MTERWQRELKKLGGVDAPVSRMRARIAQGPSEDPLQPEPGRSPRQRITAGVVAFAVFAAAGLFAWRAFETRAISAGSSLPTVSIDVSRNSDASAGNGDLASLAAQFSAKVTVASGSVEESPRVVCSSGAQCLSPPPRALGIALEGGSVVDINAYNVTVDVELTQASDAGTSDTLALMAGSTLPDPGHYLLSFEASSGGVSALWDYAVDIIPTGIDQALTPAPPSPTAADAVHLDFNTTVGTADCPGRPEATIDYGNQSTKAFGLSFSWTCPDSTMNADTTTPTFADKDFVRAPMGTPLVVTGDFTSAEGKILTYNGDYPWKTLQDFGDITAGGDLAYPSGRYVIEVTAHWSNGDRQFLFPVELLTPSISSPPPVTPPDVLQVSCGGGVPSVVDPTVAVQVDGLHVRMVGSAPPNEQLAFYGRDDFFLSTGIDTLDSGSYTGEFTRSAPTGTYDVKCYPKGANPETINAATTVQVVDPHDFWVSTALACPMNDRGIVGSGGGPRPTEEDAVRALPGVLPLDVVEPAGYTQDRVDRQRYSDYNVWRVVREGNVVAWTWVASSRSSPWQAVHGVGCLSAGIGQAGPTPVESGAPIP